RGRRWGAWGGGARAGSVRPRGWCCPPPARRPRAPDCRSRPAAAIPAGPVTAGCHRLGTPSVVMERRARRRLRERRRLPEPFAGGGQPLLDLLDGHDRTALHVEQCFHSQTPPALVTQAPDRKSTRL